MRNPKTYEISSKNRKNMFIMWREVINFVNMCNTYVANICWSFLVWKSFISYLISSHFDHYAFWAVKNVALAIQGVEYEFQFPLLILYIISRHSLDEILNYL